MNPPFSIVPETVRMYLLYEIISLLPGLQKKPDFCGGGLCKMAIQ